MPELCPVKDLNVQNFRFESSQIFNLALKTILKSQIKDLASNHDGTAHPASYLPFIGYNFLLCAVIKL